jgi:pimeloyl-ACP methyl ester carboxylesterase
MPTALVDPNIELYFTDSGPVAGSTDYTTLVIFHGTAFNGSKLPCLSLSESTQNTHGPTLDIFSKIVPFAAPDNIRLVLVNRRHYSGSTKFTDAEFQELKAGQKSFMERMGRQVANFLLWFAETYTIPQISSDRKTGGFALMGWSFGNVFTISVLGHPEAMPKDSYQKLEPYFRQLIMYGGLMSLFLLV